MRKVSILPIGSCRIYRPFLNFSNGNLHDNTFDYIEIIYPKFGFFHSIAEITQVIELLKNGLDDVSEEMRVLLFRKEPPTSTPQNIFTESIWSEGFFDEHVSKKIHEIDFLLIEVSSLNYFKCKKTNLYLHWNPNFTHNIPYSDIYPDGYYNKMGLGDDIQNGECDESFVVDCLNRIKNILPKTKIILTGHINDNQSHTRRKLNKILESATQKVSNVFFFDNKEIFEAYGYNEINGKTDNHHLSFQGERQVGISLQKMAINDLANKEHLWLSLGENCITDDILKRHKLKSFSTPYSSGRSNIDNILQLEANNYKGLLEHKNLDQTIFWGKSVVRSKIYNKSDDSYHQSVSNGFEFTLHDPINSTDHFESFTRKISRMQSIRNSENIVFLYYHRKSPNSQITELRNKLSSLSDIYSGECNICKVVLFHQTLVLRKEDRGLKIKNTGNNIIEFEFFTENLWEGNEPNIFWGRVDDDLISLMLKNIKIIIKNQNEI